MANHRAIAVTCETIVRVLGAAYDPGLFGGAALQFEVYRTPEFRDRPMEGGITLYLYRVETSQTFRTSPARRRPDGQRGRPDLALDLHFLITAWGRRASLEHTVLGWAMRVIEDHPVLPASLLNSVMPGTFGEEEAVEIVSGEMRIEDMMRIWDGLPADYQPSVPYVARVVRIESLLDPSSGSPVRERILDLGALEAGG